MKKIIPVVAAVISNKSQILCVQRPKHKYEYISEKFEFPGGKIELGETEEDALKREILEELDLKIVMLEKFLVVDHSYPDFRIKMSSYLCHCEGRSISLNEHISCTWLSKSYLKDLDWAVADIPIVNKLRLK